MTAPELNNLISETIVAWIELHGGDVDMGVFRGACAEAALIAARLPTAEMPYGSRLPAGLDGLTALDYADCRIGTHHAMVLAARYPNLPGAKAFREE